MPLRMVLRCGPSPRNECLGKRQRSVEPQSQKVAQGLLRAFGGKCATKALGKGHGTTERRNNDSMRPRTIRKFDRYRPVTASRTTVTVQRRAEDCLVPETSNWWMCASSLLSRRQGPGSVYPGNTVRLGAWCAMTLWSSSKALRCCDLEQFDQEGRWALSSVTSADDDGGKSQRGVAGKVSRGKSSADQWGLGLGACL